MAADKPNQIVDQLIDDAKTFGRNKRFLNLIMALVAIAAIFSLLYPFVVAQYTGGPTIESWLPWILVFIGGGLAMARKQLEETAATAANIDDKRVLGPMIQVLDSPSNDVRFFARNTVTRLLANCNAEDLASLSSEQRKMLLNSMIKSSHAMFVTSVIGAARRMAAIECIQPLEELAEGRSALRSEARHRVKTQAHMALADIRMQIAKQRIEEVDQERLHENV